LTVATLLWLSGEAKAAGPTSWERATQLYESGNYKQALNALASMNSSNASVHYLMGMCYKNLGNVPQARKELQWVDQYSPDARVKSVAHAALEDLAQQAAAQAAMPKAPVYSKLMYQHGVPMDAAGRTVNTGASAPSGWEQNGPSISTKYPPPPSGIVGGSPSATVSEAAKLGWKPCPGKCLKLTDSGWHKQAVAGHSDSDWWMTYDYKEADGTNAHSSYSQAHCGHIIQVFPDKAAVDSGACPVCGGTGWVRAH